MNWPPITAIDAAPAHSVTEAEPGGAMGLPKADLEPDRTAAVGGRLSVVGPGRFRQPLVSTMAELGVEVDFSVASMGDSEGGLSSARIARGISEADAAADGALVLVPRAVSIADAAPAPIVDGVPTGVVPVDGPADLQPFLRAVRRRSLPEWQVFAMGKDRYLAAGATILERARRAERDRERKRSIRDCRADRCSRAGAVRALSAGPRVGIYVGHAQPNGWSGYQTLRWAHLSSVRQRAPTGVVVHLACETMGSTPSGRPFGARFVETGRAAASLGCTGSIDDDAVSRLARMVGDSLERGTAETVGDLLTDLARGSEGSHALDSAVLSRFRLVGFPLQPIR